MTGAEYAVGSVQLPLSTLSATAPPSPAAPAATAPRGSAAVSVEGVSKTFRLPHQQYSTLKERALHPFRSTTYDELRAVQDISLEIAEGEFFGIVGRNGSGKSTLLKCIAGIYGVDTGRISIAGRLSPFIELGVGFNPDLNARDNVVINAIMLGLSRKQAMERFEHVVAFAELEGFMDLRLKNYSSGMLVRLAFADRDPGRRRDPADRRGARRRRRGLPAEVLRGVLPAQARGPDDRVRLPRHVLGRALLQPRDADGARADDQDRRSAGDRARLPRAQLRPARPRRAGREPLRASGTAIADAWFEKTGGERVTSASQEDTLSMCFEARLGEDLDEPVFAVTLRTELGHTIIVARSDQHGHRPAAPSRPARASWRGSRFPTG